jgi:acyl-CoA synthetase (AMP-forming)/AMP-acid ligase II
VANRVRHGSVVEVVVEERLGFLAWVLGAAAAGVVVAPVRRGTGTGSYLQKFVPVEWLVAEGRIERVNSGAASPAATLLLDKLLARRHPGLILSTGGTTGTPKLVLHDLAALLATIPVREARPRRILPLMRFDHIGGLDVAWRAIGCAQVLISPPAETSPQRVAATIELHRVDTLPATPSFLNLMLMAEVHRSHDLSSLTLIPYGAEPMPASLLEKLKRALPNVEFIQRFGTSETGALPVRGIGAGLALRDGNGKYAWKVVDGELWVRSPAQALGYLSGDTGGFRTDGWFRTGDVADSLPDGSIQVRGRRTEVINVGGEKVLPDEVESALMRHPMVADCRVSPKPNALLGQVVSAEIVWRGQEQDVIAVKHLIHDFARDLIAPHKLPAFVQLVKAIGSAPTKKKLRTAAT